MKWTFSVVEKTSNISTTKSSVFLELWIDLIKPKYKKEESNSDKEGCTVLTTYL